MLQGQAHMSPFYGDLSNLPHLHGLFFLLRPSKQCLTSIRACTSSPVLIHLCLPRVEKQVVYLSMSNGCRELLLLLHHYSFPFLSCWHPPPPPKGQLLSKPNHGASLVLGVQWLGIHLPIQGTWVLSLVWEIPPAVGQLSLGTTATEACTL